MSTNIIGRIGIGVMDSFRNKPQVLKQIIRDGIKDKEMLPGEVLFAIKWIDKRKFLKWVVANSANELAKVEARRRIKEL